MTYGEERLRDSPLTSVMESFRNKLVNREAALKGGDFNGKLQSDSEVASNSGIDSAS